VTATGATDAAGEPRISAARVDIAADVEFGQDVVIEADEVVIGAGATVGMSGEDDFRTPPGVRIRARRFELGPGGVIGRAVRLEGGDIRLAEGVRILRNSTVKVTERLVIGAFGTVNESCEIGGRDIEIGQELWMLPTAKIGGGSAYELPSRLSVGHYVHLGVQTLVNTARPVVIGHEVGLGTRTSIYTHGAYPSRLQGFPVAFDGVEIGDFTWVPGATINPGVRIGRNCVIGVNSLITSSIPDGALAVGSPAKVVKENAYPRPFGPEQRAAFFASFLAAYATLLGADAAVSVDEATASAALDTGAVVFVGLAADDGAAAAEQLAGPGGLDGRRVVAIGAGTAAATLPDGWTRFDPASRRIAGAADGASERFLNELRRYGIRFYSRRRGDRYADWDVEPPSFDGAPQSDRTSER
jgi:acetyltransferase-like isoleucine patch superfamily enzyme